MNLNKYIHYIMKPTLKTQFLREDCVIGRKRSILTTKHTFFKYKQISVAVVVFYRKYSRDQKKKKMFT